MPASKSPPLIGIASIRQLRNSQGKDGGWGYHSDGGGPYLNMTTAGLASLYITTDCVDMEPPRLVGRVVPGLDSGLAWVKEHFNTNGDAYGLYGCERVGLASGLKYFGTTDWYRHALRPSSPARR